MNRKKQIRLLLVDDHTVLLDGLEAVLQVYDDIKVIGKASSGKQAISICEKLSPDIILMDLVMPEMDGVAATRNILAKWPHIKIIILTSFIDRSRVMEALKEGAVGYLLKNVSTIDLVNSIKAAYEGNPSLSKGVTKILISEIKKSPKNQNILTNKEKEILVLLVEGLSNKEIAKKLVVSTSTVKFHISNILNKLQASSRLEAASLAVKKNLI